MDTAERAGDFYGYEKVLRQRYPERCLKILAMKADEEMELATCFFQINTCPVVL